MILLFYKNELCWDWNLIDLFVMTTNAVVNEISRISINVLYIRVEKNSTNCKFAYLIKNSRIQDISIRCVLSCSRKKLWVGTQTSKCQSEIDCVLYQLAAKNVKYNKICYASPVAHGLSCSDSHHSSPVGQFIWKLQFKKICSVTDLYYQKTSLKFTYKTDWTAYNRYILTRR